MPKPITITRTPKSPSADSVTCDLHITGAAGDVVQVRADLVVVTTYQDGTRRVRQGAVLRDDPELQEPHHAAETWDRTDSAQMAETIDVEGLGPITLADALAVVDALAVRLRDRAMTPSTPEQAETPGGKP